MKKYIALLSVLFLLVGCTPQVPPAETQQPQQPQPTVPLTDPYVGMSREAFYADYAPATSYEDAQYRSQHGLLSGSLEVPGQYFTRGEDQVMSGSQYLRNTDCFYADGGNTYIVVDSQGKEVMRIYKGGAYITLEEVAAYMFAFGGSDAALPANYSTKKSARPDKSIWGEYLRANHSYYSNDTSKYPYEPKLPEGDGLQYYEMDIGTTGTKTPGHTSGYYNDGKKITRGAARLVYARQDLDGNGTIDNDEVFVFYTHDHYNDFTEYLNYYGGWGQTFGNITGGGTFDSKSDYAPTPYPEVAFGSLFLLNVA